MQKFEIAEEDAAPQPAKYQVSRLTVFILTWVNFTDNFCQTFITAPAPFLVSFYNKGTLDELDDSAKARWIAIYAGIFISSYNFALFIGSYVCGSISDRIGRKPILIIGYLATIISCVILAFSNDFLTVVLTRFVSGLFITGQVVSRSAVTDITEGQQRTKLFTLIGLGLVTGVISGQIVGGFLSRPASKYELFKGSELHERHPILLTSFLLILLCAIGLVLTLAGFRETRWAKEEARPTPASAPLLASVEVGTRSRSNSSEIGTPSLRHSLGVLLKNQAFIAATATVGVVNFVMAGHGIVAVLWTKSSIASGGLGWEEENKISIVFAFGAVTLLLFMGLFNTPLIVRCGEKAVCTATILLIAPFLFIYPIANYFTYNATLVWLYILPVHGLFAIMLGTFMIGNNLLVNNLAQSNVLGAANGISVGVQSLCRGLGPFIGGVMFGWSTTNGHGFPLNYFFAFLVMGVLCLVSGVYLIIALKSHK